MEAHVSGQSNKPMTAPAHVLSGDQVVRELNTNPEVGLTAAEAARRLTEYGTNDLGEEEGVRPLKIFIAQVCNAMTLVSPSQRPHKSPPTAEPQLTHMTGFDHGPGCQSGHQSMD